MYLDLDTYIETQTKILQSETLAMKTIRAMDLPRYPEFGGNPAELANTGPSGQTPPILGAFLSRLSVKRVPDSRLDRGAIRGGGSAACRQGGKHSSPNLKEENFKSRYDSTMQASDFLSSELEDLRLKMEKSENAEVSYERDNQIWMVDANQNTTTQKLADLSRALTEAQTQLAQKEASYRIGAFPKRGFAACCADKLRCAESYQAEIHAGRAIRGGR